MLKQLPLVVCVFALAASSVAFGDNTAAAPAPAAETQGTTMMNGPSVDQTGDAPVGKDKEAQQAKKNKKKKPGNKKKPADATPAPAAAPAPTAVPSK